MANGRLSKIRPSIVVVGLILGGLGLSVVHMLWPLGWLGNASYLAVTIGASIVAWVAAWVGRSAIRVLIAVGVTLSALGDVTFQVYLVTQETVPEVSLADISWLGAYVGIIAAMFLVLRRGDRTAGGDVDGLIDMAVISLATGLVLWEFWLSPTFTDSSVPLFVRCVWAAYPVFDATMLALVVRTMIERRTRTVMGGLLAAGALLWLISDFWFFIGVPEGNVAALLDVGWMVGAALIGASCWSARPDLEPSAIVARQPDEIARIRIVIAIAPLLVPGCLELAAYLNGQDTNPIPLLAATVLFAALVGARALRILQMRDQARADLSTSEQLFRALATNSSDAVLMLDAAGIIINDAPKLAALIGHPGERTRGQNAVRFLAPSDADGRHLFEEALLSPGVAMSGEVRVNRVADGDLWLSTRAVNMLDDPAVRAIVVNVHDITALKEADEMLRAGAERLRAIFETEPECVKVVGPDGYLVEMNAAGLRMLEADSVDEVRSRKLSAFIVPEDRMAFARLHRLVMAGEDGVLEFEVTGLRGTRRRLETHATPMRDSTGEVTMLLGVTRDITEQARNRQLLAESAELMERTAEIARVGAVSFDLRTRKPSVSANVRRLLELDEHDAPGAAGPIAGFQSAETQQLIQQRMQEAIAAGTEWDFEVQLVTGGGRTIWVRLRGVVEVENGVATVLRGVLQDVTERRRLEAQLLQAAKTESIGRLAGGVAHDFNNMLTVILAGTDLALSELRPTEPTRVHLEQIRSAAERSADLTRQLLAFARQQTVEPSVIDLNSTVSAMASMLHRLIGEDIPLIWHPDPDVWPIRIDPSQFDQVLTNLVVNARDAVTAVGTENGTITLSASNTVIDDDFCAVHWNARSGDHVRIAIIDNGIGIDERTKRDVFEPFFTTKGPGTGTGLGLSTVYGIVEQNNGFITVTSAPGHGAAFEVYLPRHRGPADAVTEGSVPNTGLRGNETILVAEDEPAILAVITRILESDGFTVLAASNAAEAIRLASEYAQRIDLLLTDVVMADMNGRDLADALTAAGFRTRHLFMSGYTADIITERGVLGEGQHFIQKPFSVDALRAKVRNTLDTEPYRPSSDHRGSGHARNDG